MSASVAKRQEVIQFGHAERIPTTLTLGLTGPSGAGKTYTGLMIGEEMARRIGKPLFGIDTESGRMLQYADRFQFEHGVLEPPFTPDRYLAAMQAAERAGAGVVLVDSMSHEHDGEGGILEMHEAELTRMAGNDHAKREQMKFSAWIKPKAQHGQLVRWIQRSRVHLILCFRAKDKLVLVKNQRGKLEPVRAGWTPICTDKLDYELTLNIVLPPRSKGKVDLNEGATKLDDVAFGFIRHEQAITRDTGVKLLAWANPPPPERQKPGPKVVDSTATETTTAGPAEPTLENDAPTDDKLLERARGLLAALNAAQTRGAYNKVIERGEELLNDLQQNRPTLFPKVEAAREAAYRRCTSQESQPA